MSRLTPLLFIAVLFFALSGCASLLQAPTAEPAASFPFRHDGYDLKTAWKTSPSPEGLVIDFAMQQERYAALDELRLDVALLTKSNKVKSHESALYSGLLRDGQYGYLSVLLKGASVSPGDRLHFRLQYNAMDGSTGYKWVSDLTVDAVTGTQLRDKSEM